MPFYLSAPSTQHNVAFYFCSFFLFFFALSVVHGQSIMIGAGPSYGSDIEQVAVNTRLYYGYSERLCFGPEFSYFPTIDEGETSIQLNEFGFVAHYTIELKETLGAYPLVGINYSQEKRSQETEDSFGMSFGGGIHMRYGNFFPFAEYKSITGNLAQSTFTVGIIYNFPFERE